MQNRPLTQLELDHEGNRQFLWTNGSRLGEVAEHKTSLELQMFKF